MMRVFMQDSEVILRPLEVNDIQAGYIHWFDDAEVCAGNNHHRYPYTYNDMVRYVESIDKSQLVLAIVQKETDKHVGNIALSGIDTINRSANLTFVIGDKSAWGKGIGYCAGKLMIEHGFDQLNLHRIGLGTMENNIGMQKLAKKLGFKEEGRRKEVIFKDGNYYDMYLFGLLRKNWEDIRS